MDKEHTCCITGHRDIPADNKSHVELCLCLEILLAFFRGYTHFISGFAAGADLIFSKIIIDLKQKYNYPVTLEAAIPYPGRLNTPDPAFQELLKGCDVVKVHSPQYSKGCYMVRNRYMIDQSSQVIAVYDGRKYGGTAATIRYAQQTNCTVRKIDLS